MDLTGTLKAIRNEINLAIDAISFDGVFPLLAEGMEYALKSGGKRLRPILFLQANKMFFESKNAMEFAVALECIHSYSLVHDDMQCMDDGQKRHGEVACHIKFGEANALIIGDALLNYAYEKLFAACRTTTDFAAASFIATAAGAKGMCGGQAADMFYTEGRGDLAALRYIDERKTGALLTASIVAGAIAGGADNKSLEILSRFSKELGVLFQITDDILDEIGDENAMGKGVNKDKYNGKFTFVTEMGLSSAKREAEERASACIKILEELPFDTSFFAELTEYILVRNN